jgi:AcrR family transcriptional regulator
VKRPYHHANLHATLLDAAVALIAETGPQGFTLREVARRAGVSHNAPYRHFASKDELLRAVATEGFERLTHAMEKAMKPARTPLQRLELCGCGYVEFALRYPHHLTVMFELPAPIRGEVTRIDAIGHSAFDVLLGCVVDAQKSGNLPAGDPMPLAWMAWSLVHGIARLTTGGSLPLRRKAALRFTSAAARSIFAGNDASAHSTAHGNRTRRTSNPKPAAAV